MADLPPNGEARLRVLEEIAAATKQALSKTRIEIRALQASVQAGFERARDRQERGFRLLFGAIIVPALGLAGLIAHTQHWI